MVLYFLTLHLEFQIAVSYIGLVGCLTIRFVLSFEVCGCNYMIIKFRQVLASWKHFQNIFYINVGTLIEYFFNGLVGFCHMGID